MHLSTRRFASRIVVQCSVVEWNMLTRHLGGFPATTFVQHSTQNIISNYYGVFISVLFVYLSKGLVSLFPSTFSNFP